MSTTDLTGSTALVTGATSGIGRSTALLLARRGAHVLVSGRDPARGDAVVTAIRAAGGKADFIAADLGDGDSVRELARQATELGGGHVDILVNNAGVFPFGPPGRPPTRTSTPSTRLTSRRPSSWSPSSRPPWPPAARKRSSTC